VIPPPAVPGLERVESIKALGVTISRTFSVAQQVDALLTGCVQTLFALRTLRQHVHGMPSIALRAGYRSQQIIIMPSRRGGVTPALLTVADWRSSSISLYCLDTETRWLLHLLISVRKRMINCSTIYCIMIMITFAPLTLPTRKEPTLFSP